MTDDAAGLARARTELQRFIETVANELPAFPMGSLAEYVTVGECKLALEDLTSNLHELGVSLPESLRDQLVAFCRTFGVDESYWLSR